MRTITTFLPLLLLGGAAAGASAAAPPHASPYTGQQQRDIKALSEREIADLQAGRGMGLARAAELNGYPGPMHVLEHADALALDAGQRARTQALFDAMRTEAQALGAQLVDAERALDALFASGRADAAGIDAALRRIGALQVALRGAHLRAHVEQSALLTPEQRTRYATLRGYAGGATHHAGHHAP